MVSGVNPHGAVLTVDLGALAANWRRLRDRAAPAECAAVVKADGYGLGIEPVGRALARAGCRTFFVAHIDEAARLRAVLAEAVIYVLNGLPAGSAALYREIGARPVLGSLEEVAEWTGGGPDAGHPPPAALHVDTGMNRLGFDPAGVRELAQCGLVTAGPFALLMSHLAAAEDRQDDVLTRRQAARFAEIRSLWPDIPASLSNSSGIFHPDVPGLDLVRPGYALYGGNPTPGSPNPMQPVIRLEAEVLQLRTVEAGERVGYNGRWTAPGRRRLATLSCGYADGFPRASGGSDGAAAGSAGAVLAAGRLCPVIGR
ncbi:alanine racemase, partial [Enterovirga sp.]|uniref:alanine racemase n=1 Tax=Enterovirga sp. TaxID=2026350 RepID=UPI002635C925